MDSNRIQPEICAEVPVLGRLPKLLIQGLDNGTSLDALFSLVVDMAKDLQQQDFVACKKVVKCFEDDGGEPYRILRTLFHTFHRETLRPLLFGTLPYDLWDTDSPSWKKIYDPAGAGTYLIGLSIQGRSGAFLNRNEIEQVVALMRQYVAGCHVWKMVKDNLSHSQLRGRNRANLEKALRIDSLVESKKWEPGDDYFAPKQMTNGGNTDNIGALIRMLLRRCIENVDPEVFQLSAPVYIGCSHKVPARMIQHDPDYGRTGSSASLLRVLIACIRYIGLPVVVHTIPMVMVWEESHIKYAEMLVTVLAQSYISVGGLNVAQPGLVKRKPNDDPSLYETTKIHVWVKRPWFHENIAQSLAFRLNRDVLLDAVNEIDAQITEEQARREMAINRDLEMEISTLQAKFDEARERAENANRTRQEHLDRLDNFLAMSTPLFPDA
ncbi:hypothetical protein GGS26DRAFT_603246 [Hypomontagnella submonticulosa]|nr:hypothetical protein GGS26DRAFT_603246 [Hypomontagnella submonticulosa]